MRQPVDYVDHLDDLKITSKIEYFKIGQCLRKFKTFKTHLYILTIALFMIWRTLKKDEETISNSFFVVNEMTEICRYIA